MAPLIARKLITTDGSEQLQKAGHKHTKPLAIKGTEGMVITFPKCCYRGA